jgi:hypothetical protein
MTQLKLMFVVAGLTVEGIPSAEFTAWLTHSTLKFPVMILYLLMPSNISVDVSNRVLLWLWVIRKHTRSAPLRIIFVDDTPQSLGTVWQHLARL